MKRFSDFLKNEHDVVVSPDDIREKIVATTNRLSNLSISEVEDNKDVLIELQKVLEDILTGVDAY
jgi:hypothetical protein